ncbi:ilvB operon leader peptide IvbL [Yersinia rohdei]
MRYPLNNSTAHFARLNELLNTASVDAVVVVLVVVVVGSAP